MIFNFLLGSFAKTGKLYSQILTNLKKKLILNEVPDQLESCENESDILHPTEDVNYVETPAAQPKVFWQNQGQSLLKDKVNQRQNTNIAKNVIIFIGQ